MGKNEYAKRLRERKAKEAKMVELWTAQLCLDVMALVLNDPEVMGRDVFGKDRLQKICAAFNELYSDAFTAMSSDPAASYVREKLDDRLEKIFGPDFERWEKRYYLWDDRGI